MANPFEDPAVTRAAVRGAASEPPSSSGGAARPSTSSYRPPSPSSALFGPGTSGPTHADLFPDASATKPVTPPPAPRSSFAAGPSAYEPPSPATLLPGGATSSSTAPAPGPSTGGGSRNPFKGTATGRCAPCKNCMAWFGASRLRVTAVVGVAIASAMFLFILSCIWYSSTTEVGCNSDDCHQDIPSAGCFLMRLVLPGGGYSCSDVCGGGTMASYRPFRFRYKLMTAGDYLSCSWSGTNDAWRMTSTGAWSAVLGVAIFAMYKNRKGLVTIAYLLSFIAAVVLFLTMCMDANDVRAGTSQCHDGFPDAFTSPIDVTLIECDNSPYVSITLFDAAMVPVALFTAFTLRYHRLHGME